MNVPGEAAAATPSPADRALERLHGLSADVKSALLLDSAGQLAAATDPDHAAAMLKVARELLEQADRAAGAEQPAAQVEVSAQEGAVFCLREAGWTVVLVADRDALPSLMFFDIRNAMAGL